MKRLLLGGMVLAVCLTVACGGDSGEGDTSPTVEPGSPPPAANLSVDQVITLTQEFPTLYRVDNPDGTFQLKPSTINARVDVFCADDPKWSAREGEKEWRVFAECKKDESASGDATPPPYGFESLSFVWLFYPDSRQVMPVSGAAHEAQYPYPQPSPFPAVTPISPSPSATQ